MKTIGLIGGMSWESTAMYFDLINRKIKEKLGGHNSAKSLTVTVNFAEVLALSKANDWEKIEEIIIASAQQLERGGADIILLCVNTMHKFSKSITQNTGIPFLHIAEATGIEIKKQNLKKVGLLGTKYTMEEDFYKNFLTDNFGIEVVIPKSEHRKIVHDIIYEELTHGTITDESRKAYVEIINDLEMAGAEGVILGCTEIPLLISANDVNIPVFDTTAIHSEHAVEWALSDHQTSIDL